MRISIAVVCEGRGSEVVVNRGCVGRRREAGRATLKCNRFARGLHGPPCSQCSYFAGIRVERDLDPLAALGKCGVAAILTPQQAQPLLVFPACVHSPQASIHPSPAKERC